MYNMMFIGSVILLLSTYAYSANIGIRNYHEEVGISLANRIRQFEVEVRNGKRHGKIAGGSITDISEIPHQVGIVIEIPSTFLSFCGGTIISSTRVLTAAHCYTENATYTAALGTNFVFSGGVRVNATNFIVHPGYSPTDLSYIHDIAMVHIPAVTFTNLIQPISLPNFEEVTNDFAGHMAVVSGYGVTPDTPVAGMDQVLWSVAVQVLSPSQCGLWYGTTGSRDESICTSGSGGVGICASDSGGPLTTVSNNRRILIGLVSFGAGCGLNFPSGYVRITQYLSWILST